MILLNFFRENVKGNIKDVEISIQLLDENASDDDLELWPEDDKTILLFSKLDERYYHFLGMPDKRRWHRSKDISFKAITTEMNNDY